MLRTSETQDGWWANEIDKILAQREGQWNSVSDSTSNISWKIENVLEAVGERIEDVISLFKDKIEAFIDNWERQDLMVDENHWTENFFQNDNTNKLLINRVSDILKSQWNNAQMWWVTITNDGSKLILEHNRWAKITWRLRAIRRWDVTPRVKTKKWDKLWPRQRQLSTMIPVLEEKFWLNTWWIK